MERKYYLRGLGIGIAVTAIIMGIVQSGKHSMSDEEIIARAKELGMVENTVLADTVDEGEEKENAEDAAADDTAEEERQKSGVTDAKTDDAARADGGNASAEDAEAQKEAGDADDTGSEDGGADSAGGDTAWAETDSAGAEGGQTDLAEGGDMTSDRVESATTALEREEDEPENVNAVITSAAVKTITVSHGDGSYTVARKLADVGVVTSAENFDTFLCQNGYDKKLRTGTYSIPADASEEQIARIVTGAE